jgi:hypothetical protein
VRRQTRPLTNYERMRMSFSMLGRLICAVLAREIEMEFLGAMPEWLVWCAVGVAGAIALATLANVLDAALELDAG